MCFSALVTQRLKKLKREFDVELDYVEAKHLFRQRLADRSIRIAPEFESNFFEPGNADEQRIKGLMSIVRKRFPRSSGSYSSRRRD